MILERIHLVLGHLAWTYNIQYTYVDEYYIWIGILATIEFSIFSNEDKLKVYTSGLLIFFRDMILPNQHKSYWELIHEKNQEDINKYNNCKNRKIVY